MKITSDQISLYRSLFRGREDIYACFWSNAVTHKSGFAPVYRLNKQSVQMDDDVIKKHLIGIATIGIYPLLSDNRTCFLAIDFDEKNWLSESVKVCKEAEHLGLPGYLERSKSGNGSHVWFFFQDKLLAWKARQFGKHLLQIAGITRKGAFDRMFPSQDEHTGKGIGNLISLPLQGKFLAQGNTAFIDEKGNPYSDQWQFIETVLKISEFEIDMALHNAKTTKGYFTQAANNTFKKLDKMTGITKIEINSEDKAEEAVKTTESPIIKITLSNQIYIPSTFLPDKLYKLLKEKLNFPNPLFYELERKGYSTWNTSRFIKTIEPTEDGICIPAGFLSQIEEFVDRNNLVLEIEDKQITTKKVTFLSTITLRPEQKSVSKKLFKYNRVILEAQPGFGKTVIALDFIKKQKQKTLVVVHTKQLIDQWSKQIQTCFTMNKKEIGVIGENKWRIGEQITIASYHTLVRRGTTDIASQFGLIVVDECHHIPANTFAKVLKTFPAKHVLGLTATTIRMDKLERLMNFYIGPTVIAKSTGRWSANNKPSKDILQIRLFTKQTQFTTQSKDFNEIGDELIANDARNGQIVSDLSETLKLGTKCLVLTERIEHCKKLYKLIRNNIKGVEGVIAVGKMTKKNREKLLIRVRKKRFQFLIATGKLVGEGFDWPELTNLFLTYPCSWKGKLIQYIGRIERSSEGKTEAFIYDYIDYGVPMLRIMYFKRLRTYRSLGIVKEKTKNTTNKIKISEDQLQLF